ncbi:uncharacterized protein LOC112008980 [Quercus suber]|uniref:uncharacterized protein LOC112008980 n=1 Tax=Quercus suber TaxID=58331 RepID=UPI0032DF0EEA
MPGEDIKKKATKTHSSRQEHGTTLRRTHSSRQEHETPKSKPQSSRQEHGTTLRRAHSSRQEHETPKSKPQSSRQEHGTTLRRTHSSRQEHETPKSKPQSSRQEHGTTQRRTHSSRQEHETPKSKPQSSRQEHGTTKRRTHSGYSGHKFERKNYEKPYWCDGCKEQGYGSRYKRGNVELHRECLFPSPTTSHECFQGYHFKFLKKTPGEKERCCDACGMDVKGFVYHCEARGWDLHPCCRNLKNEMEIDGVKFQLCCNKVPKKKCLFCKKKELPNGFPGIPGWSYVSKTESDKYHFHVYCSIKWVIDSWKDIEQQDNRLTLNNLALTELKADSIERDGKDLKYWRIAMLVLRCTASLLLGDPTQLIFSLPDVLSFLG